MNKFKAEFDGWMEKMFGPEGPAVDLRKNTQAMFAGLVSKFDLITREEFEVQTRTLAEAIKKLEAIENKLGIAKKKPAPKKARKSSSAKKKAKPKSAAATKSVQEKTPPAPKAATPKSS